MEEVVLEVLERRGRRGERRRIVARDLDGPFTIGRSFESDLILDDPSVSNLHAQIEATEEGLVLVDCSSTNGVVEVDAGEPIARSAILPDARFRIGRVRITFRKASGRREKTVVSRRESFLERRYSWLLLWGASVSYILLDVLTSNYKDEVGEDLIGTSLVFIGLGLIWCGGWSLISRILVHRFGFYLHAAAFGLFALVMYAFDPVWAYVVFRFSAPEIASIGGWIVTVPLIAWLFHRHLTICAVRPLEHQQRRLLIAIVISSAFSGLLLFFEHILPPDFDNKAEFSEGLLPPSFTPSSGDSMERFLAQTEELKRDLEEQVKTSK